MRQKEAVDWIARGHEAGSHTLDHVHLTKVSHEAVRQIILSKHNLENMLQCPIISFAYPYGDENSRIRDIVRNAGYHFSATVQRGRARKDNDLYGLLRHRIRRADCS